MSVYDQNPFQHFQKDSHESPQFTANQQAAMQQSPYYQLSQPVQEAPKTYEQLLAENARLREMQGLQAKGQMLAPNRPHFEGNPKPRPRADSDGNQLPNQRQPPLAAEERKANSRAPANRSVNDHDTKNRRQRVENDKPRLLTQEQLLEDKRQNFDSFIQHVQE